MAFYNKPKNVRYVDMAIYIDKNIKEDDANDEVIFEYLYHLVKMLAFKRALFNSGTKYEDFAIYLASKLLIRLKRGVSGELPPIKSSLNYIKKVLYPEKVIFEKETYKENVITNAEDITNDNFKETLIRMTDELKLVDFKAYFSDIPQTVYSYVSKIPHKDKAYVNNIYLSCILSILSSITLSVAGQRRLNNLIDTNKLTYDKLYSVYDYEKENGKVYYHVDPADRQLVDVLVNKLRHIIAEDLSIILNDSISSDYMQTALMSSVYSDLTSSGEMEN